VSQWTTTVPVENWMPSRTVPTPETPDTSKLRTMVKGRMPSGARSRMLDLHVQHASRPLTVTA